MGKYYVKTSLHNHKLTNPVFCFGLLFLYFIGCCPTKKPSLENGILQHMIQYDSMSMFFNQLFKTRVPYKNKTQNAPAVIHCETYVCKSHCYNLSLHNHAHARKHTYIDTHMHSHKLLAALNLNLTVMVLT